jgi:hypothetical protein
MAYRLDRGKDMNKDIYKTNKFNRTCRDSFGSNFYAEEETKFPYLTLIFVVLILGVTWLL